MNNMHILSAMSVLVFTHICVFGMGFIIAFTYMNKRTSETDMSIQSFFDKQRASKKEDKRKQISIDDTKVVLDIKTDNLEKKFDKLGTNSKSKNDIKSSINKLKSMRG